MLNLRLLLASTLLAFVTGALLGQARRSGPRHLSSREVRSERILLTGGIGLLPTFLTGGEQVAPALQASAQYYFTERLAVGMAYARASTLSDAYVDGRGVSSQLLTEVQHLGLRLNGSITRSGPLELYGGLQLGVNLTEASQTHAFPTDASIGDEAAYLAWRTDPFVVTPRQVSAIGFFGASLAVVRHANVYLEAGNNLALLTAGLELRL